MSSDNRFDGPIVSWLNKHAPQGIMITDANLVIRDWNGWLEMHSGIPKAQVEGRLLYDVFPDIVERGLSHLYGDVLRGQVRIFSHRFHRYLIPMASPSEPQFEQMQQTAHIGPLMDEEANVIGTLTAINDVTERIAREGELREARETAEAANLSKDRFVAMLSHDLRVPLNSVVGWVQLMKARVDDPEIRVQGLKSIEQNAHVQLRMIEDLLDLTRISSGKLTLDVFETEIGKVVEEALSVLKPLADAKSIRLEQSIQIDAPIRADAKRLQQVVWNLVSNALKFTPSGGAVHVQVAAASNAVVLKVTDTGIGLSRDALIHIFEPMWQVKQGGNDSYGGLGLGLTIVHKVVELHGGSVRAESPGLGLGATFIVELPRDQTQSA